MEQSLWYNANVSIVALLKGKIDECSHQGLVWVAVARRHNNQIGATLVLEDKRRQKLCGMCLDIFPRPCRK